MKKFWKFLAMACVPLCVSVFAACSDDDDDEQLPQIFSASMPDNDLIVGDPVIDTSKDIVTITFSAVQETTAEQLQTAFAPVFSMTSGATISPESGSVQDFSDGYVTYTVTFNGKTKEYRVYVTRILYANALISDIDIDFDKIVERPAKPYGSTIVFTVSSDATADELSALAPTITLSDNATVSPESGVAQDFSEGSVTYTVTSEDGSTQNTYEVKVERIPYTDNGLTAMSFDSELVTTQPVISGNDIVFYVTGEATAEDIAALAAGEITVSDGATVSPAAGEAGGFAVNTPVTYTVTSEHGEDNVYNVTCRYKTYDISGGFESWTDKGTGTNVRPEPDGWATANDGLSLLMAMNYYSGHFGTLPDEDAYKGSQAIKMVTLDTKGEGNGSIIPKITSGSAFLGKFQTVFPETLRSTKFGIEFTEKPIKVTGQYKYTAGETYYHNMTVSADPEDKDAMAMTAVLYEVTSYDETLTGEDINTSDKIVAFAYLSDGTEKTEYTPFELILNYTGTYDPDKLYKFAVIFSSSDKGIEFMGAPGSTLIVDDVEVIIK